MHDAGGGEVDVEAVPHVAHHRSEHPLARDHDGSIKCHRTEGHQHVGEKSKAAAQTPTWLGWHAKCMQSRYRFN